eukprot:tig00000219_g19503.t1
MSITTPESAFAAGCSAFVDENFEDSLVHFNTAIQLDASNADFYRHRAHTHIKLANYTDAVADANKAIELDPSNATNFMRKGVACFELSEYESAKTAFEKGLALQPSNSQFKTWIRKCDAELQDEQESRAAAKPAAAPAPAPAAAPAPAPPVAPAEQKIRHEWYQNNTHVFVTLFVKNVDKEKTKVEYGEQSVHVMAKLSTSAEYQWELEPLWDPIDPAESTTSFSPYKIEMKLKKRHARKWDALEEPPEGKKLASPPPAPAAAAPAPAAVAAAAPAAATGSAPAKPPSYPSSSKVKRDWGAIDREIEEELGKEKPTGEDSLTKLLQDIYSKGNEETRRAMNKSFVESGGTVLSTNWKDVGKKPVEGSAPAATGRRRPWVESGGTVLSTNWKDVGKKRVEGSAPNGMEMHNWTELERGN